MIGYCINLLYQSVLTFRGNTYFRRELADRCWRANREKFEELAKLKLEPGYKNVATFKSALYDLARRYPAADHFVWRG